MSRNSGRGSSNRRSGSWGNIRRRIYGSRRRSSGNRRSRRRSISRRSNRRRIKGRGISRKGAVAGITARIRAVVGGEAGEVGVTEKAAGKGTVAGEIAEEGRWQDRVRGQTKKE